jgi:hypothetical protein
MDEAEPTPMRVDIEWSNGFTHHVYLLGSATTASGLFFLVDDPLFGLQQVRAWSLTRAYLGDGRCHCLSERP